MILHLKKLKDRLIPCDDVSVKVFNKLKDEDEIYAEYKPRRNYQFHKKLFSMLNLIKNNQSKYHSVETILEVCKYDAGYYEILITPKGEQFLKTLSISFHNMDSDEFSKFYSSCIDTCLSLVPLNKREIEDAVLRYC